MKKLVLLISLIAGLVSAINAQWVSPGNGTTYTLPDLVNVTEGAVTASANGFLINSDITISTNDVLLIDNQVSRIDVATVLITINGSMVCTNTARVGVYGLNETNHFGMRFEDAIGCEIKKMYFSDGGGIKVIDSEVTFDDVRFLYFVREYCNAVIDVFNCDPVIVNCHFQDNKGAAISSPANGQSSPQILNNYFDANVKDYNVPQINLGPGGADTIRIVGNQIEDQYTNFHTGGISVGDLMGIGSTKVLVKNNSVRDGRYGYNQQGANISSLIIGNQFINNYNETNPMNGGSGISIYGTTENCRAILRNNVIIGNLWGITVINKGYVNMGTPREWGYNEIHDNRNSGAIYDLYNNTANDITAVGNDWGTTDEDVIESHIVHQPDDPNLGLVNYIPYVGYDGIEEVSEGNTLKDRRIYTIEGRCLGTELPEDYKGVYIKNGEKYIK